MDRRLCKSEDKGLFVEARYLQMTDLEIPYEIEQRNLRTLLLTEETAKETFTQQAAIIEKETEQIVGSSIISFNKPNNRLYKTILVIGHAKSLEIANRTTHVH